MRATVLTERRVGKMWLSEGALSLNSQILVVLIDSINWHNLVRQGRDFVEFNFNLMHRGCQASMIDVHGEGEGIKPEPLGSSGAFVACCRGASLPSFTIPHGFLEEIAFFPKASQKAAAPSLGHPPICGKGTLCFDFFYLLP